MAPAHPVRKSAPLRVQMTAGASLTRYGSASCRCFHRANRIPWGAIGPASMTAKRWLPSFACSAPAAKGIP